MKPQSFKGTKYYTLRYMREDNTIGELHMSCKDARDLKDKNNLNSMDEFKGKVFDLNEKESA